MKSKFFMSLFLLANTCLSYCQNTSASEKANEYFSKATKCYKNKDYATSVRLYKLCIAIDSNAITAYTNLALDYQLMDVPDSAIHYYAIAFRKDPTADKLMEMADVEESRHFLDADDQKYFLKWALYYYGKIIELDKDNPEGYYGSARMMLTLGDYDDALSNALTAERLYKQMNSSYIGDCHYILSVISYKKNNISDAKKYFALCKKEGATTNPETEEILSKL
jgi:tetratricopeptide (TPR) repeat protein